MGIRGRLPTVMRGYVVRLARTGEISSLEEGALIAGVSRVAVGRWLRDDGIDLREARGRYIAKHIRIAARWAAGRVSKRPTKAELHRMADRAKRDFEDGRRGGDVEGRAPGAGGGCDVPGPQVADLAHDPVLEVPAREAGGGSPEAGAGAEVPVPPVRRD